MLFQEFARAKRNHFFLHSFSDINECKNASLHNCDLATPGVACLNTPGGFQCTCKTGFSGDGVTCNGMVQSNLREQYNFSGWNERTLIPCQKIEDVKRFYTLVFFVIYRPFKVAIYFCFHSYQSLSRGNSHLPPKRHMLLLFRPHVQVRVQRGKRFLRQWNTLFR